MPQPSEFYLEVKRKYDIKTEYIKKYGSANTKNQAWDILRLWMKIIEEKINEENGLISFEIYKMCLKNLSIPNRWELRFLCNVGQAFIKFNPKLAEDLWNDIVEYEKKHREKSDGRYHPDWCEGVPSMIDIAYKLKKVNTNDEKLYLSSVLKVALEKCHPMDLDNINGLLNKLNAEDKD